MKQAITRAERQLNINVSVSGSDSLRDLDKLLGDIKAKIDGLNQHLGGSASKLGGLNPLKDMLNAGGAESVSKTASTVSESVDSIVKSVKGLGEIADKFDGTGLSDIFNKLTANGMSGTEAAKVVSLLRSVSGEVKDVSVNFSKVGDEGERVGSIIVSTMEKAEDATVQVRKVISEIEKDGSTVPVVTSVTKVAYDTEAAYKAAADAVKEYYDGVRKAGTTNGGITIGTDGRATAHSERWAETANAINRALDNMQRLTSEEAKATMQAEQRKKIEEQIAAAQMNAGIAGNKRADAEEAKAAAEQYKAAADAVKEYYALLQKMYSTGSQGTYYRENIVEQNGVFVAKEGAQGVQEYVSQLNSARMAMETYKDNLNDLNLTEEQRKNILGMITDLQDKFNVSMENAERSDAARQQKAYNDALENGEKLLREMVSLREKYAGNGRVASNAAFGANDANISSLQDYIAKLRSGEMTTEEFVAELQKLRTQTDENASSMNQLSGSTASLTSGMTRYIAMMFSSYRIIMSVVRGIKQLISTSIELDSAMAQMQIVTRASDATMQQFGQTAAQVAKDTATSITDVLSSATTFARLGYSLDDSAILAKYTGMIQRVGDIDVSDAQDAITAIIKAWNIDVSQIEDVMDKLVTVGNNFPISVSQIAEGMNNASSSLSAAGNTFEQSVALLTAANTTVQNAAKASTGLRTITARLRNTTAELEELGEEPIAIPKYEELVQTLTDYKVSLLDEVTGQYRSTYDILYDLAQQWDKISPNIQAAITTGLSGTRQQAVFLSIINQFKEASGAMDAMTNSAGALNRAYNTYLETAQAHIETLKASVQELSQTAVDRGLVTTVVDLGNGAVKLLTIILKLVDATTGIRGNLALIVGLIATLNMSKVITQWDKFGKKIKDTVNSFKVLNGSIGGMDARVASWTAGAAALTTAITAVLAIQNMVDNYREKIRLANERIYDESMSVVKETDSIYNAYEAYRESQIALDETAESKQRLISTTKELAEALNIESEAARESSVVMTQYSLDAIQRAIDESNNAIYAAQKNVFNTLRQTEHGPYTGMHDAAMYARKFGVSGDVFSDNQDERVQTLIDLYDKLIQRQSELTKVIRDGGKEGKKAEKEYNAIDTFVNLIRDDVELLNQAENALATNRERLADLQFDQKLLSDTDSSEIRERIHVIREYADAFNELTNGNVDYRRRPLLTGEDLLKVWKDADVTPDQLVTTYTSGFTIGEGEFLYTVDVTPILEDGTILTPEALEEYVNSLVTDDGIEGILESDTDNLVVHVEPGDYDESVWGPFQDKLSEIKSEHADMVQGFADDYGIGFKRITGEIIGYLDNMADDIPSAQAKLERIFNSDNFEKTKEKLIEMSRAVDGISAKNIKDLAAESGDLADILNIDGMNAQFLAGILQRELTTGDGFSLITEEALRLNKALDGMIGEYDGVTAAKTRYDNALAVPEKDADFKSMAEAFAALNGEFEAGTTNSNKFWAAAEFLFGEEQLELWGWADGLEAIRSAMQENEVMFKDAESSGAGFLTRLKEIADAEGNVYDENNNLIASINQLEDGSWKFDIDDLSLDELAKKMNISRSAIEACVRALDKWGHVDFVNIGEVLDAINQNRIGTQIGDINVVNQQALEQDMRDLQRTGKEIQDIMNHLAESGALLIDVTGNAQALADGLSSIGIAVQSTNGITIDINGLAELLDKIQMSEEDANELILALSSLPDVNFTVDGEKSLKDAKSAAEELSKKRITKPKSDLENVGKAADGAKSKVDGVTSSLNNLTGSPWTIKIAFDVAKQAFDRAVSNLSNSNGSGTVSENNNGYPSTVQYRASGTKHAAQGEALAGEVEPELWVHDGQARLVGTNGPEIINLGAGDIIYNGQETRKIMKSLRYIHGTIPAFASGTVPSLSFSGSSLNTGSSVGSGGSGSGGSSSSNSNSDKEETWFEREYKLHQHMLKMEAEDTATYLNWLNNAYQTAYNTNIIVLDDYRRYAEEVHEGVKNLFLDYLSDIEHEISMRSEFKGERKKIISLYRQMIGAIEDEIQAARARGLTDTDDYIQELQSKWTSYFNELSDMREDIMQEVESSTSNLIDIRIQMIKQDVSNEKDALQERLSNLKEFYDKQKDLLRESKEEEDYLDNQAEKRKAILDIQTELRLLERDTSASAQKRIAQLNDDLAKAQKDLDKFERDHAIELAEKEIDRVYESQEKELEAQIKLIESQEQNPHELYEQALSDIRNGSVELYQEMIEWNNMYGDGIERTITNAWEDAYKALEDYKELMTSSSFAGIITNLYYEGIRLANATGYNGSSSGWDAASVSANGRGSGMLSGYSRYASGTKRATPGLALLDEEGTETYVAKDGTKYRMFTGGEMVLDHKASQFLYKFATTGGEVLSKLMKEVASGMSAALGQRQLIPQAVNMGDIIIQGNADMQTVSEIRRAQRESVDYMLREFNRLNR